MGVTGLWSVVQPCARPVKLETLNRKRLAVDASIWIYQFLKAVRDKEGNALRNAHVVGFFRRICKLLYYGIKPVFVFDGGAPVLKRQTIAARRKRREGRREDAVRTAGKLLAIQIQRLAEEEKKKRKAPEQHAEPEEEISEKPSYVDEIFMTEKEKRQNRKFRKKDAYHLPDLDVSLDQMGAPDDPRIMSQEELEEYARQFYSGEDISVYDFSKIDFDSPFFRSLPVTDQYNILHAARVRSRLRMGYSKEQLDAMFPDRMAFSKFQIERVRERNDLTQRLMTLNGMNGVDGLSATGQRIAGERGKEYVLVKDPDVEGGWALGVVGNKAAGQRDQPIDVDDYGQKDAAHWKDRDSEEEDGDGFEDVPIEGLNRLPKIPHHQTGEVQETKIRPAEPEEAEHDRFAGKEGDDALFIQDTLAQNAETNDLFEEADEEDEDLRRAIALSLENPSDSDESTHKREPQDAPRVDSMQREFTSDSEDENDIDFSAALKQSKRTMPAEKPVSMAPDIKQYAFEGPLPFEPLKVTRGGKAENKEVKPIAETAGGFVREDDANEAKETAEKKEKKAVSIPPWFAGEPSTKANFLDEEDVEAPLRPRDNTSTTHIFMGARKSPEVIDVDKLPDTKTVIDLDKDDDKVEVEDSPSRSPPPMKDSEAMQMQSRSPTPKGADAVENERELLRNQASDDEEPYDWEPSDDEGKTAAQASGKQAVGVSSQKSVVSPGAEDVGISNAAEAQPSNANITANDATNATLFIEEDDNAPVDNDVEYSDPEDEELMAQLAAEAEEHARFASMLNNNATAENAVDFEQELKQLRNQQRRDRRDADEVSQIMVTECQQLLRLFGVPYITAPMEAEAQCAKLVSLGLVDGIITDDSDIFLFGGTRVYKNMFNQDKYVECFLTSDMEKEYALDRKKLIQFAHLLGSDYTEGIPGVGPVTALEIVTEFRDLVEFRDWWTQIQMGVDIPNDPHSAFRKKFKKRASKLFLPPNFPDPRVDAAYLEPEVDSDPSEFQWGVPDLDGLRSFLMSTIGWSQERTDQVLLPVIRDMNQREREGTQSNITRFISGGQGAGAFAPRVRSQGKSRMEKAFSRLRAEAESRKRGADDEQSNDDHSQDSAVSKKRRKGKTAAK